MSDLTRINEILDDKLRLGWNGHFEGYLEGTGEAAALLQELILAAREEAWDAGARHAVRQERYSDRVEDPYSANPWRSK